MRRRNFKHDSLNPLSQSHAMKGSKSVITVVVIHQFCPIREQSLSRLVSRFGTPRPGKQRPLAVNFDRLAKRRS